MNLLWEEIDEACKNLTLVIVVIKSFLCAESFYDIHVYEPQAELKNKTKQQLQQQQQQEKQTNNNNDKTKPKTKKQPAVIAQIRVSVKRYKEFRSCVRVEVAVLGCPS